MRHACLAALTAAALLSTAASATTSIVYSNSKQANPATGVDIASEGNDFATGNEVAHDFTLAASTTLKELHFIAETKTVAQHPAKAKISIYANTGSGPQGDPMYTTLPDQLLDVTYDNKTTGMQRLNGYDEGLYTVDLPDWALDAGKYYISVSVSLDTGFFWSVINDPADTLNDDWTKRDATGFKRGHAENAFWLVGEDTVAAAVPETASWALMLGGFGMIGGVMRAGRRHTVVRFG